MHNDNDSPTMCIPAVFAGHGLKSLTVEVRPTGIAYLYVSEGNAQTLITLTDSERYALSAALRQPGKTTEIAEY